MESLEAQLRKTASSTGGGGGGGGPPRGQYSAADMEALENEVGRPTSLVGKWCIAVIGRYYYGDLE